MLENRKISEIITENYSSSAVFMKYGIDFCCGGGITLKNACANKNLDLNQVEQEILQTFETESGIPEFQTMTACLDYILEKHHVFELNLIKTLKQLLEKLVQVHSQNYPEILEYEKLFKNLENELYTHFPKEENILFPFIRAIERKESLPFPLEQILQPVQVIKKEHEEVGNILWKTVELTSNFRPPEYACNTWRAFLENWKTLIQDIQKHVFVENEILFPMLENFVQTKKI